MFIWTLLLATVLAYIIWKVNKVYYILSFCAKRVRTVDGTPVEQKVPIQPGSTIFGNAFDLFGLGPAGVFMKPRQIAKLFGRSYVAYGLGVASYHIIDAEDAEAILTNTTLLTKAIVYNFIQPALHTGLLTSTDKKWHTRRKMLTPTFHFNILDQFLEIFKTESFKFVNNIAKEGESTVLLNAAIPKFTLNTICETAMGIKLDEMSEKGDRYRVGMAKMEDYFVQRASNPLYWNNNLFYIFGDKTFKNHLDHVHAFCKEIIAKRRELFQEEFKNRKVKQTTTDDDIFIPTKKRFATLDTLICAEQDGLIDEAGICEEVVTLMFAGFDTTSVSLTSIISNLAVYPELQQRCYEEILEHTTDDISGLEIQQLNKLKYLECFIKETIRKHPVVSVIGRQTTEETTMPNGLIFPVKSQFYLDIYDLHHNPKYYKNPDEFDPERFQPENAAKRHTFAYIPFSAGPRNCIGQKYAMLEIKTLLVAVLRNFKLLPLQHPKDFLYHAGITARIGNTVKVKFNKRI